MNNKVMKKFLSSLMVGMMVMMVGCSVNDDDVYVDLRNRLDDSMNSVAVYDGEWTVNRQVVDTALLRVSEGGNLEIRVRLPEHYLLGLCFPDGGWDADAEEVEPAGVPSQITAYVQGYSEQTQYLSFASTNQKSGSLLLFSTCSMEAVINGSRCLVYLISRENAGAILQGTGLWTLAIPVDYIVVVDETTGQNTTHELPATVTLYYNAKRRIG